MESVKFWKIPVLQGNFPRVFFKRGGLRGRIRLFDGWTCGEETVSALLQGGFSEGSLLRIPDDQGYRIWQKRA
jgi:hypothetical protein